MTAVLRTLRSATRVAAAAAVLLVALSVVPSDEAYYRIEWLLSETARLGSASQQVRSVPATAVSLILEIFHGRYLEVEGVEINLKYAVNPTEQVEEASFTSRALGEERSYSIYLPPGYEGSEERYPALYLLHGMGQGHRWWTEVARVDRIATAMIASGKIRPLIIVMPNGNRVERDISTTSLYDDHCETGLDLVARVFKALGDRLTGLRIYHVSCDANFEDYIAAELVREVGNKYRTNGERYIGGFSLGGRGAMQLALGYDGVFAGAFGLSGNYDYLRRALENGGAQPANGMKLLLASGDKDQRGVYGELNTFLFHKELARRGIEHRYCTYDGTHTDTTWIAAMPEALRYLLGGDADAPVESEDRSCKDG